MKSHPGFGITGQLKVDVCDHNGRVLRHGEWRKNLMLDRGMDLIAEKPICDVFLFAAKGMASTATSAAKTGTWTLSGTALSLASGSDTLTAASGDAGKLIRSADGKECIIVSNDTTSAVVKAVGSATLTNFTGQAITLYAVDQDWLDITEDDVTRVDAGTATMDFDGTDTITSSASVFTSARDVGRYIYFNDAKVRFKITAYVDVDEVTVENTDSAAAITGDTGAIYDPVREWTWIDPDSTTFDYNGSTTLTRNGSTGDFEFSEDHVGAIFYNETNNARLRVTAFNSIDSVTVVELDTCAAFGTPSPGEQCHLLTDDDTGAAKSRATQYVDGECGTATSSAKRTFTRSFMFPANERDETYYEIILSDEASPGDNANIRVVIPATSVSGPVSGNPGERLKVTYQLVLTVSPASKVDNASTPITGSPWSGASVSVIESFATSVVDTDGSTDASYMALEPSAVGTAAYLGITTLSPSLTALNGPKRTAAAQKQLIGSTYVAGSFRRDRSATLEAEDAIGSNWRGLLIYDPSSEVAPFVTQYLTAKQKLATHRLSVSFRTTWSRTLS